MNTVEYLDAAKHALNGASDYKLAKLLGRQTSWIARFRASESAAFDDEAAIKIAEILDIDPLIVIADMHLLKKRSNTEFWEGVKRKSAGTAAAILATVALGGSPHKTAVSAEIDNSNNMYYARFMDSYSVGQMAQKSSSYVLRPSGTTALNAHSFIEQALFVLKNCVAPFAIGCVFHCLACWLLTTPMPVSICCY